MGLGKKGDENEPIALFYFYIHFYFSKKFL